MQGESTTQAAAVEVINSEGLGPVLLLCEHASNHIPARYDGLGLPAEAATSHAAWDPGARALSICLSKALDAPMIASTVSRLVYDCNRPPQAPSAMPEKSELVEVPGNRNLSQNARDERARSVYVPFCEAVNAVIAQRKQKNLETLLVTVHSFTPVFFGRTRAVEIGILHDCDRRLADCMLDQAKSLPQRRIERNAPYGPDDGVTHSLVLHGIHNGLPNVMIEVRNDLLQTDTDVLAISNELLQLFRPAIAQLTHGGQN